MTGINGVNVNIRALVEMFILMMIGASVLDKINATNLINLSGPFGTTGAKIASGWTTLVMMLSVITVIVIAKVVMNVFNGGGEKERYAEE
jgi:hypothetical protein